jgi:antitoxin (DNA-binding transcriptional repressor) of toxin-antitoxin stability system
MNRFKKIAATGGVTVAFLFAFYSLATPPRVEKPAAAQVTKTENDAEAERKEFRSVVLRHMEMGETVTVTNDRIGYLDGVVKLVPLKRQSPEITEMTKSTMKSRTMLLGSEIERIAGRLRNPAAREGLTQFARTASEEDKYIFMNVGRTINLDDYTAGTKAVPTPTEDPQKKCYDSCQTLCHTVTTTACKWDCRIVNSEKVCTESCPTIATEVCNVVCKKTCD